MANRYESFLLRTILALLTIFLISCGSSPASHDADEIWPSGLSAFAAMHDNFPCATYIETTNYSSYPVMPVLYGTFGTNFACIAEFVRTNGSRPHVIEIHFSNEACRRNKRCFDGEIHKDLSVERYNALLERDASTDETRQRVRDITSKISSLANPHTRIILTTGLEDNYSDLAFKNLRSFLEQNTSYEIARSPVKISTSRDYVVESHGLQHSCDRQTIASNDGVVIGMSEARDFGSRTASCAIGVFWTCGAQGTCGDFTPPLSRSFSISWEDALAFRYFLGGRYDLDS